jgi:hypothetical protein
METIQVPMMKEMFMSGLVKSIGEESEEGKEMSKYLTRCLNGEYSSPIGPLTIEQTKLQEIRNKFKRSDMKIEDIKEYDNSIKKLRIFYPYQINL